jgi:hypothetical protein
MKPLLSATTLGLFLLAASGCVVHRHHPARTSRTVVVHKAGCKPSHYWDGYKCRHKGKGHGARKHDD